MDNRRPRFFTLLNPIGLARFLYGHRELLWQFSVRGMEVRHKGSALGLAWAVLNPLTMLVLYVFVFRFIFSGHFGAIPNETGWDYALGIFLGLCFHHLVAEVIATAPHVVVGNANLVKKVVFPVEILPAAAVGASILHFAISVTLVFVGISTVGPGFSIHALWFPVVAIPMLLLALGLGWLIAALGVFIRDIGQITPAISAILLFASAVFYSAEKIPPAVWAFLRFNPLLQSIELAREVVLWHQPIQALPLFYTYGVGLGVCLLGFAIFARLRGGFADVL